MSRIDKFVTLRALVVGEATRNTGGENPEGYNQALITEGGYKATLFYPNQEAAAQRAPLLQPTSIVNITGYAECHVELTRKDFDAVWFNLQSRRIAKIEPVEAKPEDYGTFARTVYEDKCAPKEWAARQAVA